MRPIVMATCLTALAFPPSAASQRPPPPLPEADIVRRLTSNVPAQWLDGVAWGLSVPPDERSPVLRTAMIAALEREVAWDREQTGPWAPSFKDQGEGFGETSAILARELAATGDPRVLPALAWHAYNWGPVGDALFAFGHQAVPHLLAVATSPEADGDIARASLHVLASIVSALGPGGHERELAEAAVLHLESPPEHYRSTWSNRDQMLSLLEAIGLASVLRTPELLGRLGVLAGMSPEEVIRATGRSYLAEAAPSCARHALLDEAEERHLMCDPTWWVRR